MQESPVSCGDLVGLQGKHVCSVHNLLNAVFTTAFCCIHDDNIDMKSYKNAITYGKN